MNNKLQIKKEKLWFSSLCVTITSYTVEILLYRHWDNCIKGFYWFCNLRTTGACIRMRLKSDDVRVMFTKTVS